jgi:hypothetical protein
MKKTGGDGVTFDLVKLFRKTFPIRIERAEISSQKYKIAEGLDAQKLKAAFHTYHEWKGGEIACGGNHR